jgi:hypothetical protein
MSNGPVDPFPFEDTIPLDEAETLTTNWRDFIAPLTPPGGQYIRAFYIPITDIVELARYHQAEAVRAYLCLTVPNDPSTAKIVLVPIDQKGNDITSIIIPVPIGGDSTQDKEIQQSTIYDLTQPCPAACDYNSPLYDS